ncbi:RNA-binding protein MEX3B [Bacillus rossius redtenbacheri]|uniref:RNA-binding protein MEX3B n=1 Tax=Bacillus rossius redtenbacheri TaxID=93214 RepID=UPI002FDF0A09
MPASLFSELDESRSCLNEQKALVSLAFELSMLNLDTSPTTTEPATPGDIMPASFPDDSRGKKSQNMTECVPVPSSEHVAEIVGRQGCKIKALRAKTNTYIKTPVRGEEPVFVVTGRKEDVAKAKREILSAAEHFSQIRASRKNNLGGGGVGGGPGNPPGPPANLPGQVTIQVRVPYRVVGLVVGPKGATIKRIQQQTHTYIVTPSRDKEPVFEVTGMPESVEAAKHEIEAHIAMRTGVAPATQSGGGVLSAGGGFAGAGGIMEEPEILASLCKSGFSSLFSYLDGSAQGSAADLLAGYPPAPSSVTSGVFSGSSSSSSSSSSGSAGHVDIMSIWSGSLDQDDGLGDSSPTFDAAAAAATASSAIWSFPGAGRPSPAGSASPADSLCLAARRDCTVCGEREVDAALVPCGHNLFCLECASRLCGDAQPASCPVCQLPAVQAIRIFS